MNGKSATRVSMKKNTPEDPGHINHIDCKVICYLEIEAYTYTPSKVKICAR